MLIRSSVIKSYGEIQVVIINIKINMLKVKSVFHVSSRQSSLTGFSSMYSHIIITFLWSTMFIRKFNVYIIALFAYS